MEAFFSHITEMICLSFFSSPDKLSNELED